MTETKANTPLPLNFEGREVRALAGEDGEPWFPLADVLNAMGSATEVGHAKRQISQGLGDEMFAKHPIPDSLGRPQQTIIVNEPAITFLVAQSRTEAGKRLNRFIHGEVLPMIRRTGAYADPAQIDMKAVGGMMKSVVGKALHEAVETHLPRIVEAKLAEDPRVAVQNAVSAREVLDDQKVPSKGRRGLVRKASNRLLEFSAVQGHRVHYCARTGTRLFEREAVAAWLDDGGRALIQDHMDRLGGQARLRLVESRPRA